MHLRLIQYVVLALNYNSVLSPNTTGVVLICFSYAFHLLSSIQYIEQKIEKEHMRTVPITQEKEKKFVTSTACMHNKHRVKFKTALVRRSHVLMCLKRSAGTQPEQTQWIWDIKWAI